MPQGCTRKFQQLRNRNRRLPRVCDLDNSTPGTHQFGCVIQRGHVANQHGRCSRCPGRRRHRHTWHRRQDAKGCRRCRRHRGIGHGGTNSKGRNVDDGLAIHDGCRWRACGQHLICRQDKQAAGRCAKTALHRGTCANKISHTSPPGKSMAQLRCNCACSVYPPAQAAKAAPQGFFAS